MSNNKFDGPYKHCCISALNTAFHSRDAEVDELRDKLKEAESKERLLKADLLNVTADRDNLKFMMDKLRTELDSEKAKWEELRTTSFANRPDVLKKMEEIERGQVKPNGD